MEDWVQRDSHVIWHPYTQMQTAPPPIPIVRASGATLYDSAGNAYFDAISSWWVTLHGHSHPYLIEKIHAQLQQLDHVLFAGATHPAAIELAERLLKYFPQHHRIFYSDNGSTAVEVALKMALQTFANRQNPRSTFIAFEGGYHGDTVGAMSVSSRCLFTDPFLPLLFKAHFIPPPFSGHEEESIAQLKQILEADSSVAAFIFEPLIQGVAGMQMHSPQGLDALIRLCHEQGIWCIADEVFTGFGRTGRWFASDFLEETPDLICLSKGLTGGVMAAGATLCTDALYQEFLSEDLQKTFFHGHSYSGNPVACAAALASLDLLEQPGCWESIQRIESRHHLFAESLQGHPQLRGIRRQGTILALELEVAGASSYLSDIRRQIVNHFMAQSIWIRPLGNTLYFVPPYCTTDKELDHLYHSTLEFLQKK